RPVIPPGPGRGPPAERADRVELERAEKRHKRLVAWRWLALRFPDAYRAREDAEDATARLNDWIEDVLRQQSSRARADEAGRGRPVSKHPGHGPRSQSGDGRSSDHPPGPNTYKRTDRPRGKSLRTR
ncbi:MAG: SUV3 C-terminal domain-containing protein, partial [Gluconacetobacter sp.]